MLIPKEVLWLMEQFQSHGYECFLVGGCVRDHLLHRPIHDFDLTTNATPQEMLAFLPETKAKVIPTGLQHGTLTVLYQNMAMEVTTYRQDGAYEQHRRPKEVLFAKQIQSDLARRDFTINAMAYHPDHGIIDPFHGQDDLAQGIIRCVGDSRQRFEEDALRILRALRFAFQLQFTLDQACEDAIKEKAPLLTYISKERIQAEWNAMLLSEQTHLLSCLRSYQVLPYLVPALLPIYDITQESKWHLYDVFTHTDIALDHTKGYDLSEKLAIVFHDVGKAQTKTFDEQGQAHFYGHPAISADIAKNALRELKYPKQIIEKVRKLVFFHDYRIQPTKKSLRRLLAKLDMDYELAYALLRVQHADNDAKNLTLAQNQIQNMEACLPLLKAMQETENTLKISDLQVNGYDLMAHGYQGKQIKDALQWLYQQVIDDPTLNHKETLMQLLKTAHKRS